MALSIEEFQVGIITALDVELAAAISMLDEIYTHFPEIHGDVNAYTFGRIGKHNVVIVGLPAGRPGHTAASTVATNLTRSFPNLRFGLMVGIGGGVPTSEDSANREIHLGDVVVSNAQRNHGGVVQYDYGRALPNGLFKQTGTLNSAPTVLSSAMTNLKAHARIRGYRIEEFVNKMLEDNPKMKEEYQRPPSETDRVYPNSYRHVNEDENDCQSCSTSEVLLRRPRADNAPRVHYGLIGSGNQVVRDPDLRDKLHKARGILCFEMEAAGLMNDFQCVVIRGISDYCDSHKNKVWHPYAAAVAAAFAKELLLNTPFHQVSTIPKAAEAITGTRDDSNVSQVVGARLMAMNTVLPESKVSADLQVLRDLRITHPRDDKSRIESFKGGLLKNAYIWVMSNDSFLKWMNNAENKLLHIKGEPGKGKTMLICGIITELSTTFGAYFFFQESDVRINNATAALRGIIFMLANERKELIQHIREKYDPSGKALFEDVNSWVALREIFVNILKELESYPQDVVIVIDAINECTAEGRSQLLELIIHSTETYKVKWIVSSRSREDVDSYLKRCQGRVRLSLKYNFKSVRQAVDSYIDHRVKLLTKHHRYDKRTQTTVYEHLKTNADHTFLWVSLVCQHLEEIKQRAKSENLGQIPKDLDELYLRMKNDLVKADENGDLRKLLAMATVTYRPLTLREFATIADIAPKLADDEKDLKQQIKACGGFLSIRDDRVEFVHQSAKEFVLKEADSLFPGDGLIETHYDLYCRLLKVLQKTLKRDILDLDAVHNAAISLSEVHSPSPNPLDKIEYACFYWPRHLQEVCKRVVNTQDDLQILYEFLRTHLLHWIEAMSFYNGTPQIIQRLYELFEKSSINQYAPDVKDFLQDAHRFASAFRQIITKYPLQIYHSGLVFSPSNSLVRQAFTDYEPKSVRTKMSAELKWSEELTRLWSNDSPITALAYDSSGNYLACGFYDGKLELWNVVSGVMQKRIDTATMEKVEPKPDILTPDRCELKFEFFAPSKNRPAPSIEVNEASDSLDQESFVTGYEFAEPNSLHASGVFHRRPSKHEVASEDSITELAFQEESMTVVFAVGGRKAGFWNTETETCDWKPELDTSLGPMIISAHGKYMASGMGTKHVVLCSTKDCSKKKVLGGVQPHAVSIIHFSPDGELLATCSQGLITTWRVSDQTRLLTFKEPESHYIIALSLFPDGKQMIIASGSPQEGERIKMIRLTTGKVLWTIVTSHCERLYLSPDGEVFVATRKNYTTFYRTSDGTKLKEFSDNRETLCVCSRISHQIATTDQGGVRLFSISDASNKPDTISAAILAPVRKTYYGNECRFLATESLTMDRQGMVLAVYNTEHSRLHRSRVLPGSQSDTDHHFSAASPIDSYYAYVHHDWTKINLLDMRTLDTSNVLGLPEAVEKVVWMCFSHNGKYLAAGTADGMILVWDIKTGDSKPRLNTKPVHAAVKCLIWSDNSIRLAAKFGNDEIAVWNVLSGKRLLNTTIRTTESAVLCIAFSPDGLYLVATHGGLFENWIVDEARLSNRVLDRREKKKLPKYFTMAVSKNNRRLACASNAGIELWDLHEGVLLHYLDMKLSSFDKMAFSADDTSLRLLSGVLQIREAENGRVTLSLGSEKDIFVTQDWIFKDHKPLMWLPDAFRSKETQYRDGKLILHHEAGRVALLDFSSPPSRIPVPSQPCSRPRFG